MRFASLAHTNTHEVGGREIERAKGGGVVGVGGEEENDHLGDLTMHCISSFSPRMTHTHSRRTLLSAIATRSLAQADVGAPRRNNAPGWKRKERQKL